MSRSPREVVDLVLRMVKGEPGVEFPDLFAEDGVMEYPFGIPGMPMELKGRAAVQEFFEERRKLRQTFEMEEATVEVHETADPEVVIAVFKHHGMSHIAKKPYAVEAVGIIRVRDGEIVHYRDYMNPLAIAELTGRTDFLIERLTATGTAALR